MSIEDREAVEAMERLREAIAGDRRDWHQVLVRPDDIAALLAHLAAHPDLAHKVRAAIPAEPKHRGAPGGVHNHGTEDGPGVACREYLIGACRADAIPARWTRFSREPDPEAEALMKAADEGRIDWDAPGDEVVEFEPPPAIPAEPLDVERLRAAYHVEYTSGDNECHHGNRWECRDRAEETVHWDRLARAALSDTTQPEERTIPAELLDAREAVVGYLMRGGYTRSERVAERSAIGLILTVLHPHLRWDLDYDHETDEHRRLRAALRPDPEPEA